LDGEVVDGAGVAAGSVVDEGDGVVAEQGVTAPCPIPEVARLGRTLAVWRKEFLA
jgi:hypothetical protein